MEEEEEAEDEEEEEKTTNEEKQGEEEGGLYKQRLAMMKNRSGMSINKTNVEKRKKKTAVRTNE